MKLPRVILGKIGQCIYCGTTQKPLITEHIVPFGLNGPWELLEASCHKCARVISEFEFKVLRESLIVPRAVLDFPTRRKHLRPKQFPLSITKNGKREIINVPIHEHFAVMILPIYGLPAYLDKRHYEKGIDVKGVIGIQVGGPTPEVLGKKYGTKKISVSVIWHGNSFERLLAKIAYGFSVAYFGLKNLKEAYILPAILGERDDIGYWVGCANDTHFNVGKYLHQIDLSVVNKEIIVRIKLFAIYNVPEYLVVVGRLQD